MHLLLLPNYLNVFCLPKRLNLKDLKERIWNYAISDNRNLAIHQCLQYIMSKIRIKLVSLSCLQHSENDKYKIMFNEWLILLSIQVFSYSKSFIVWFLIIKPLIANIFYTDTIATQQMYSSITQRPMPGYLNTILCNLVWVVCAHPKYDVSGQEIGFLYIIPKISSFKLCLHRNWLSYLDLYTFVEIFFIICAYLKFE